MCALAVLHATAKMSKHFCEQQQNYAANVENWYASKLAYIWTQKRHSKRTKGNRRTIDHIYKTMQLNHKNRRLKYLLKHRHQLTNFQAAIYSLMNEKRHKKEEKREKKRTSESKELRRRKKQTAWQTVEYLLNQKAYYLWLENFVTFVFPTIVFIV